MVALFDNPMIYLRRDETETNKRPVEFALMRGARNCCKNVPFELRLSRTRLPKNVVISEFDLILSGPQGAHHGR
jgi:hypothetical protein